MWHLWNLQYLLLYFTFGQFYLEFTEATWPSTESSNIRLLGLFADSLNASKPSTVSVQLRAMFKSAILLSQQYNITIEGKPIGWEIAQTGGNVIDAIRDTCLAVSNSNIVGIVGPGLSREAEIIAGFGKTIGIPVISYSATDPDLSDRTAYSAFYRTVPSDNAAAKVLVKLFIWFNWTSCIIIYQNDAFGSGGSEVISKAFINNNLTVQETVEFDITTRNIRGDLQKYLRNSSTRIVILWTESIYASLILQNALDNDVLGPQFTWILSSSPSLDSFNETVYDKLIGILTVEPVVGGVVNALINTTLLDAAYHIWKQYEPESFPGVTDVVYYALFAFDATWSLIESLQKLCSTKLNNSSSCISIVGPSFCFDRRLLNSNSFFDIINTNSFLGVSGPIQFVVNVTDRISGIYYHSQNIQPSFNGIDYVPVIAWCEFDECKGYTSSSIIVWPGNSLQSPTGNAKPVNITFKIGIIISNPFAIITNITDEYGQTTMKFVGYNIDLIGLLQKKMGFIPNLTIVPLSIAYSDAIQYTGNGVYDMLVGDITITAARRQIARFSTTIFDTSLRIIVRKKPDYTVNLLSYLKPFTVNLWIMILVTSICAAIFFFVYEQHENEALKNRSIISSTSMSVWYCIGTLVGYGVDFKVKTAAGRLLTVSLYILSLVLVATYTANLVSDLTILKSKTIISGIEDIKNGKIPFNRIGIRVNSAIEAFYLREVSDGIKNYYPLKSRQELLDSLLNGIIDISFLDEGVAEYITNSIYCNLTLIGPSYDQGAFGIVTPKQWLYAEELDFNLLSLEEEDSFDQLKKTWFKTDYCQDSSDIISIAVDTMAGLFVTFAAISILSLVLFAWTKRHHIKNYFISRTHRIN